MYQDLRNGRMRIAKEAAVSVIFNYSEQLALMICCPVSRSLGHSFYEWGIVQACWKRLWKASLMVSEIGPRHWTGEQGAAAVVSATPCTNNADVEGLLPALRDTKGVMPSEAWLFHGQTVLNHRSWSFLLAAPCIYILHIKK
jgi:hypothetical protein